MQEIGERLRARARELGLSDVDVARRLGLDQTRYSKYVNGDREPDFATFIRICRELETTPDAMLGFDEPSNAAVEAARDRIASILSGLDVEGLEWALDLVRVAARRTRSRTVAAADPDQPKPRERTAVRRASRDV